MTKEDWQALQTAFEQFENVDNLDISGLTKITEMPENALKEVKWLKELTANNLVQVASDALAGLEKLVTVEMNNVTTFSNGAFSGAKKLQNIALPKAEVFGAGAFKDNDSLVNLSLPSAVRFGTDAFLNDKNLFKLSLPKVETIGSYAFYGTEHLETLNVPELKTIGSYSFTNDAGIKELNAPKLEKLGQQSFTVKTMDKLIIPSILTIDKGSFSAIERIKELSIGVTTLDSLSIFPDVVNLTLDGIIELPDAKTTESPLTQMKSLTSLTMNQLVSAGDNTLSHRNLRTINVPKLQKIGNNVFINSSQLERLDLPKLEVAGDHAFNQLTVDQVIAPELTKLGDDAFSGSYSMLTIDLPRVTEIGDNAFQLTELKNISLPHLNKLGANAFSERANFEKVTLGIPTIDMLGNLTNVQELELNQVKTIVDYQEGLSPLSKLTDVSKLSMLALQKAGNYAFYQTTIKAISAPKATTLGDYAFYQDKHLTNVQLQALVQVGNHSFEGATSLTQIHLPKVTNVGDNAFAQAIALETVTFPLVETIGNGVLNKTKVAELNFDHLIQAGVSFQEISTLKVVNLPALRTISGGAFGLSNQIKTVVIGTERAADIQLFSHSAATLSELHMSNLTDTKNDSPKALANYRQLKTFDAPNLEHVGYKFFEEAPMTTIATDKITSIDAEGFAGTSQLTALEFPALVSMDKKAFLNSSIHYVVFPKGSFQNYALDEIFNESAATTGIAYGINETLEAIENTTVTLGESAVYHHEAHELPFTWKKDGVAFENKQENYTITGVSLADSGKYTQDVTLEIGNKTKTFNLSTISLNVSESESPIDPEQPEGEIPNPIITKATSEDITMTIEGVTLPYGTVMLTDEKGNLIDYCQTQADSNGKFILTKWSNYNPKPGETIYLQVKSLSKTSNIVKVVLK